MYISQHNGFNLETLMAISQGIPTGERVLVRLNLCFQHSSGEIVLRMGRMSIVPIECNFGLTYLTLSIAMTLLQKRLLLPVMT